MNKEVREKLNEITRRIVKIARPEKIVLFGSAVRAEMNKNSDLDLLVVKSGDYHKGHLTEKIYMQLFGIGQAVDIILVTPEEVEQFRNSHPSVIKPALDEGKVVYEREQTVTG